MSHSFHKYLYIIFIRGWKTNFATILVLEKVSLSPWYSFIYPWKFDFRPRRSSKLRVGLPRDLRLPPRPMGDIKDINYDNTADNKNNSRQHLFSFTSSRYFLFDFSSALFFFPLLVIFFFYKFAFTVFVQVFFSLSVNIYIAFDELLRELIRVTNCYSSYFLDLYEFILKRFRTFERAVLSRLINVCLIFSGPVWVIYFFQYSNQIQLNV